MLECRCIGELTAWSTARKNYPFADAHGQWPPEGVFVRWHGTNSNKQETQVYSHYCMTEVVAVWIAETEGLAALELLTRRPLPLLW